MALLSFVIRPFSYNLFITYYVKLRLLLFNIGFLTLLLVQTCSDVRLFTPSLALVFCNESRDTVLSVN